jgi:hypothetical protein
MKPEMVTSDPDLIASFAALKRAAKAARKLAEDTGTPFYVWQDGRVVNLNPRPKRRPRKRA